MGFQIVTRNNNYLLSKPSANPLSGKVWALIGQTNSFINNRYKPKQDKLWASARTSILFVPMDR